MQNDDLGTIPVAGTFESIGTATIEAYVRALQVFQQHQGVPVTAEESLAILLQIICTVTEKVYEHGLRTGIETGAALAEVAGAMEPVA